MKLARSDPETQPSRFLSFVPNLWQVNCLRHSCRFLLEWNRPLGVAFSWMGKRKVLSRMTRHPAMHSCKQSGETKKRLLCSSRSVVGLLEKEEIRSLKANTGGSMVSGVRIFLSSDAMSSY